MSERGGSERGQRREREGTAGRERRGMNGITVVTEVF